MISPKPPVPDEEGDAEKTQEGERSDRDKPWDNNSEQRRAVVGINTSCYTVIVFVYLLTRSDRGFSSPKFIFTHALC